MLLLVLGPAGCFLRSGAKLKNEYPHSYPQRPKDNHLLPVPIFLTMRKADTCPNVSLSDLRCSWKLQLVRDRYPLHTNTDRTRRTTFALACVS